MCPHQPPCPSADRPDRDSAHTIAFEVEAGRLAILDVVGMPIRRQWFSVMRNDHAISPAMATFHDFLMRQGARYLPLFGRLYPDAKQHGAE